MLITTAKSVRFRIDLKNTRVLSAQKGISSLLYKKIHAKAWIFFIQNKSNIKQEVHHITIFNDVIFPFRTHLACFFRALLTLVGDEVFKRDSLRANEAFLEVGVDLTGRLRRGRTDRDGSRAYFFTPALK